MSDPVLYSSEFDFSYVEKKEKETTSVSNVTAVLLKILIGILSFVIVAELFYYICIIPSTATPYVTVEGLKTITQDEIISLAGLSDVKNWKDIDRLAVMNKLALCPLFESVQVQRVFPDKVEIIVKERQTALIALVASNGKTIPVHVDRTGMLFKLGGEKIPENSIFISGISLDNARVGDTVAADLRQIIYSVWKLEQEQPALCSLISEIKVEKTQYGANELVLYPTYASIPLRTKGALNERLLRYMMLVLDVVQDLDVDIEELDFRAGTVSYRIKGE